MISFKNATLLSYDHSPKFFGDSFVYGIQKSLTVKGVLDDFTNTSGVSGVSSGIYDLVNLSKNYDDIVLNGVSFGSGYITNISVDRGNWVRIGEYTADIQILGSGNLYNMTGEYFTGLYSFTGSNLYFLKNFSENFSLSLTSNNTYDYKHSAAFGFESETPYSIVNQLTRSIASGIMQKEVPFALISGYTNFLSGKKYYEESYDLLNKQFSFTETFSKNKLADDVSADFSYSLERSSDGTSKVTENIKIIAISDPKLTNLKKKIESLKTNLYSRCQSFYSNYLNGTLASSPITQGYEVDKFNGTVNFNSVFSDNPFSTNLYQWTLDSDIVRQSTKENVVNVSLNIIGAGANNTQEKFNNAIAGLNAKYALVATSRDAVYSSLFTLNSMPCNPSSSLKKLNNSYNTSFYDGEINIGASYTDRNISTDQNGMIELIQSVTSTAEAPLIKTQAYGGKQVSSTSTQKSTTQTTITKMIQYGKNVILRSFPNVREISLLLPNTAVKNESIKITPMKRRAEYSVTFEQ